LNGFNKLNNFFVPNKSFADFAAVPVPLAFIVINLPAAQVLQFLLFVSFAVYPKQLAQVVAVESQSA